MSQNMWATELMVQRLILQKKDATAPNTTERSFSRRINEQPAG